MNQVTKDAYRNIIQLPVELQTYIYGFVSYKKEYDDVIQEFNNLLSRIEHTEMTKVNNNLYVKVKVSFAFADYVVINTTIGNVNYLNIFNNNEVTLIDFIPYSKCILQFINKVPFEIESMYITEKKLLKNQSVSHYINQCMTYTFVWSPIVMFTVIILICLSGEYLT